MTAIIDPRMPCSAKARIKEICEVIELPPFSALDERVASHPDMLVFLSDGKLFTCNDYYKEAKEEIDKIVKLKNLELILTNDVISSEYPNDVCFNAFIFSGALIGNIGRVSDVIKAYCQGLGLTERNVRQGYAKCSTVLLGNAVITADAGISKAVKELGGDALLISQGQVELEGYDCGFIGGASGVYENKVYFCGDISTHPDHKKIAEFCNTHGFEVISLSRDRLYDVGTILFI